MDASGSLSLLCRVDTRLCALPLEPVWETTRRLPIEPVAGAPDFVLGLSLIRGAAVPVVDAGLLLSGRQTPAGRFVVLKVGERRVALAIESVIGIRSLGAIGFEALPPLIHSTDANFVSAIGALDAELLLVLHALRIVPEELLASMERAALAS